MGRHGHGRSLLLLEKLLFSYFFFSGKLQLRALKIDPKTFGSTGREYVYSSAYQWENCHNGKITVSWKLFSSIMTCVNTNLRLIQSRLS